MMNIEENSVFAGSLRKMFFINVDSDNFEAKQNVVITRNNFFLPNKLALKVHKAFFYKWCFYPGCAGGS